MLVIVTGAAGALARHLVPRGSSNEKAGQEFGREPRYASWREGFRAPAGG